MSDGENPAPILLLPGDADWRDAGPDVPFWRRSDWPAIIAALLLHAVVIAALLVNWRWPVTPPPESIPVRIVFAPPPAPAAPPAPAPKPNPYDRESGKDQRTTAPPAAESASAEPTRPPEASAPAEPKPPEPQVPASGMPEKPVPPQPAAKPKTHDTVARLDPRREADRLRARHPAPDLLRIEPGDQRQSGDPYLNRARDLIEAHRTYPNVLGKYGVPVEGTPVYEFLIDRKGHLLGLKLVTSSGTAALDEAGAAMIRATAPFPPLPADAPGEVLQMIVTLPLYPK
ncbi:MAG TPA: TonB family protein [Stellaceae bacterium]|nr:TonB family protein [Stellaceae bacterium]